MSKKEDAKCQSGEIFVYIGAGVLVLLVLIIFMWKRTLSSPNPSGGRSEIDEIRYRYYRSQILTDHTEYRVVTHGKWSDPVAVESYENFKTYVSPDVWLDTLPNGDTSRIITEPPSSISQQEADVWIRSQRQLGRELKPHVVAHTLQFRINNRSRVAQATVQIRFTVKR